MLQITAIRQPYKGNIIIKGAEFSKQIPMPRKINIKRRETLRIGFIAYAISMHIVSFIYLFIVFNSYIRQTNI